MAAGVSLGETIDSREVVQADEILAAIERGEPVDYDGVIVEGDLDLSGMDLPTEHVEIAEEDIEYGGLAEELKVVESSIKITNSELQGNANFSNAVFKEPIFLDGTNFNGHADFKGTNFSESAYFSKAKFSSKASFLLSQFSSNAAFWNSQFSSSAEFCEVKFTDYADFSYAKFENYTDFSYAKFENDADFSYAKFEEYADFWGAEFEKDAYFWEILFNGDTDFGDAKFSGYAGFNDAKFVGDTGFWRTVFSGYAYFEGDQFSEDAYFGEAWFIRDAYFDDAQFASYADFTDSRFDEIAIMNGATFRSYLSLNGSRIYNIKLLNIILDGESLIYLTDSDFSKLQVQWAEIKDHLAYDPAVYLALIKNFKNLEQMDYADDCYYEYRLENQKRKPLGTSKISDWLQWISYGYGVRPGHTIASSLFIIILFGLLLKWGGGIQRSTYPCQVISQKISTSDVLYFSTLAFVSQPPYNWGPREGSLWKYVVLVEDILGWIFLTLFVIALT